MKKKEPKNTGPPDDEGGSVFKSKKRGNPAKKFEQNLPEVAKRNNIRVSSPYGYYPEDVDKVVIEMENDIKMLQKERDHLTNKLQSTKEELDAAKTELTKLKMQVAMMEVTPSVVLDDDINNSPSQNKIIKSPKKKTNNLTIVSTSASKTAVNNGEKPKKGPAVISLNLNNKKE